MASSDPERPLLSLTEALPGHFPPGRSERVGMLTDGMVCVDTNVLLDFYRFTPTARDDLAKVLRGLGDRLFVPFQVALEFQESRLGVIRAQGKTFDEKIAQLDKQVRSLEDLTQSLTTSVGHPDPNLTAASDAAITALRKVVDEVTRLRTTQQIEVPKDDANDEPIQRLVVDILTGHVGSRPDQATLDSWRIEAEDRYSRRIPPGFEDSDKINNPHGDYLLWRQLLDEARRRDVPVVLVSQDRKSDWVRRDGPLVAGPLPALVEEMLAVAGVRFSLIDTKTFLEEARDALSITVDESTLTQARPSPQPDLFFEEDEGYEFDEWLLSHPEVFDIELSSGRTWRRADLQKLLGKELVDQLDPFRGVGHVLPKQVLLAAYAAKMTQGRLAVLLANTPTADPVDADYDSDALADHAEKVAREERRLARLLRALPGVILPVPDGLSGDAGSL